MYFKIGGESIGFLSLEVFISGTDSESAMSLDESFEANLLN